VKRNGNAVVPLQRERVSLRDQPGS
jgi:hypothetical protein